MPNAPEIRPADTALDGFGPAVRVWFSAAFPGPTPVQEHAWPVIRSGANALLIAPTGSGKTLAAFLSAVDGLFLEKGQQADEKARPGTRVVYISPLKALAADVRRNLVLPLEGIALERAAQGEPDVAITVGMRTGDTPAAERAALVRRPPDILITTPESLYLMLTSKARETLRDVRSVIVDEVHAMAGTKRGSHLAVSLERLDMLLAAPAQRIGLSATVRPVEDVARFLGGSRPVAVIDPPAERRLELKIIAPVEDMTDLAVPSGAPERVVHGGSIWYHVETAVLERILASRSTIVFVNSRGLAERMTARLNELYAEKFLLQAQAGGVEQFLSSNGGTVNRSSGDPPLIAMAHHGSVSRERRTAIEEALKAGDLLCVVATSSLELGIDMGEVDQVIQIAPPPSVASGLQRVGRAGHHVGGTPSGVIYPRTRRDLVDAAVTAENMLAGRIEALSPPRNPLDVLAQQTVAAVAVEPLAVDDWYQALRRTEPFRSLSRAAYHATLDMLAGRFPSDEFSEFRPRLVWDRTTGLLTARPGAQRLAVVNGGTIPDRGTYRVVLPEGEEQSGSRRVGELDEEMVHESRINDVITLGASSWRIREITTDQVVVTPAPGRSARLPFWHGEGPGRPAELGLAVGEFIRSMDTAPEQEREHRLTAAGMNRTATANLLALLADQKASTGSLPTDATLVVEQSQDEVGDWRVLLHSPYGKRVHAPWALAVGERVRRRFGLDPSIVASDDGIVARFPDTGERPPGAELFLFDPATLQQRIAREVDSSALFAARFRECATRALLMPRRAPGRRSPLWQQRLRAGQLLEAARQHSDFPILVETARECLQDVYDLPALVALMERLQAGEARLAEAQTKVPSPFASNLLFGYVAEFMYKDDAPLAERRTSLLSLDSGLLRDLLGETELGELLDASVIEAVAAELQRTAPDRRAFGLEGVADLLRELGPLRVCEVAQRLVAADPDRDPAAEALRHLHGLREAGRVIAIRLAGEMQWAAVEDAARLRDALGVGLPPGIPDVFLEPVRDPLRDLLARHARTHGPFTTGQVASRFGLGVAVTDQTLERLRDQGRLLSGDFGLIAADQDTVPNPLASRQWIGDEVFSRIRLRSLRAAREATRPVEAACFVRQLLERQHVLPSDTSFGSVPQGLDGVLRAVEQLGGLALPASLWESRILPARVPDFVPGLLDEAIASGEVLWSGKGKTGNADGMVALHLREMAAETLAPLDTMDEAELSEVQSAILDVLSDGGAFFAERLANLVQQRLEVGLSPEAMQAALWDLVWAGRVTSDSWSPVRAFLAGRTAPPRTRPQRYRQRRPGRVARAGPNREPAALAGRWSLVPTETGPETARTLGLAYGLLDRYGVVTRNAAVREGVAGGFPALQQVFRGMEDAGRVLRGRFVKGMGAAQFAETATIDRLREIAADPDDHGGWVVLSAADPANPFGDLIPWPVQAEVRPTRHPGALVMIRDGRLVMWLSQGGRRLVTYGVEEAAADEAAMALASGLAMGNAGTLTIEEVNGVPSASSPLAQALRQAGFSQTPKGLAWYGRMRRF